MKFVKIDLLNTNNTTLLAMGFMERLFPSTVTGDIYYYEDLFDMETPVRYIYFTQEYYEKLYQYVCGGDFNAKISQSNAYSEWKNLAETIKNGIIEDEDIGLLKLYGMGSENFEPIDLNISEIENILKIQPIVDGDKQFIEEEVLKDLKRIYKRLSISVSGLEKGVGLALTVPLKFENQQKFSFYPILEVLNKYGLNVKDIDIFKGVEKNFMHIYIAVKEWSNKV